MCDVTEPADFAGQPATSLRPMGSSPTRISDAQLRFEAKRAFVWTAVIGLVILAVYISQSLLVIFGAMVFASMIDGGVRLLGRGLRIGRIWRVGIVLTLTAAFFYWLVIYAGSQISREAAQLPQIIEVQISQTIAWLDAQGFAIKQDDIQNLVGNLMSGMGNGVDHPADANRLHRQDRQFHVEEPEIEVRIMCHQWGIFKKI